MDKKTVHMVTFTLAMVGALNWGLVGLLKYNLVESILGMGTITQVVYILVGLSAVYVFATHASDCKLCGKK